MAQTIISGHGCIRELNALLANRNVKKIMLVRGRSFRLLPMEGFMNRLEIPVVSFDGFASNPDYEDVVKGVDLFRKENCDAIVAVGGGSAIDVAKCIKLYCKMDPMQSYLGQRFENSGTLLIAVPTTGGTGSESTQYAVIYHAGQKQSVTHESIVPDYALLDPGLLETLPLYQKKCTMLDALCHGVESWWSVNSTSESRQYSKIAVESIVTNYEEYIFGGNMVATERIMFAANCAGRAIGIAQTTVAHAMSYKLTSIYGCPHGHAVALCLPRIWQYMTEHPEKCDDSRGMGYLNGIFRDIAFAFGCGSVQGAISFFDNLLIRLGMEVPTLQNMLDLSLLSKSVNLTRLKNSPIEFNETSIYDSYARILGIGR